MGSSRRDSRQNKTISFICCQDLLQSCVQDISMTTKRMFELTLLIILGFIAAYWYNQTKAIEQVRRLGNS